MRGRPWGASVLRFGVDGGGMLVAAVGEGAVGDVRSGGDDAGDARQGGMPSMPGMPAGPAAPSAGSAAPAAGNAVYINNFAFAPATLTVPAGSTVTWTNQDEEPHTVVANDGSFHSPGMGTQATFSFTFTKAGHLRLRLLDPPVHARHRGGDAMTDEPHTHDPAPADPAQRLVRRGGRPDRGRRRSHLPRRRHCRRCAHPGRPTLRFAQVSDSHIGFTGTANPNVADYVHPRDRSDQQPGLHTGLRHPHRRSHPSGHAGQFDQVKQMMTGLKTPHIFTVPGEHDSIDDGGQKYRRRSARVPAATGGTASTSPACTSSLW